MNLRGFLHADLICGVGDTAFVFLPVKKKHPLRRAAADQRTLVVSMWTIVATDETFCKNNGNIGSWIKPPVLKPIFRFAQSQWVRVKRDLLFQALKRLSGKTRKHSNIKIFQAFATQPAHVHRRLKMWSYFCTNPMLLGTEHDTGWCVSPYLPIFQISDA